MAAGRRIPSRTGAAAVGRQAGLTLVELLVAFSILGLMALMGWRALDALARVQDSARQRSGHGLALESGLLQWRTDLDALQESGMASAVDFNGQVLRITRRSALDDASLMLVAWALRLDSARGVTWQRWVSSPLRTRGELRRAWLDAGEWARTGPFGQPAARGGAIVVPASEWQLFYFRDNAWSHAQSSARRVAEPAGADDSRGGDPVAADTPLQPPPDAVRLVLTLPPQSGSALAGRIVSDWLRPTLATVQ